MKGLKCRKNLILTICPLHRSRHWSCSIKKGFLNNFAKPIGKHLWQSLFFKEVAVWGNCSCEFCNKIFNNTFFTEHLRTTASSCNLKIFLYRTISIILPMSEEQKFPKNSVVFGKKWNISGSSKASPQTKRNRISVNLLKYKPVKFSALLHNATL